MKTVAFTIALLACAVLEQTMQTNELRETTNVISGVAVKSIQQSIATKNRYPFIHEYEGIDSMLTFLEKSHKTTTTEQLLARLDEMKSSITDHDNYLRLELYERAVKLMAPQPPKSARASGTRLFATAESR